MSGHIKVGEKQSWKMPGSECLADLGAQSWTQIQREQTDKVMEGWRRWTLRLFILTSDCDYVRNSLCKSRSQVWALFGKKVKHMEPCTTFTTFTNCRDLICFCWSTKNETASHLAHQNLLGKNEKTKALCHLCFKKSRSLLSGMCALDTLGALDNPLGCKNNCSGQGFPGCFAGSFHLCECSVTYTPSFTHKPTHIAIWPGEGTFSESLLCLRTWHWGERKKFMGPEWPNLPLQVRLTDVAQQKTPGCPLHSPVSSPGGSFLPELQLVYKGETGRPCLGFSSPHWGLGTPGSELKQSTDAPAFASPLQGPLSYIASQPLFVYSLPRVSVEAGENKPVPVTPSWPRAELPVLV